MAEMAVLIWAVGIFCAMLTDSYYPSDLAWVHHNGYAHHVEKVGTGIVRLLHDGLGSSARILSIAPPVIRVVQPRNHT